MTTSGQGKTAPIWGCAIALIVPVKGQVIVGIVAAACVLALPCTSAVLGEQTSLQQRSGMGLLDEFAADTTPIRFGLTEGEEAPVSFRLGAAAAESPSGVVFLSQTVAGRQYAAVDRDVAPARFNQQGADATAAPSTPSYLNPDQPAEQPLDTAMPRPSYLEGGNEDLTVDEQLEQLHQRLTELEATRIATEDATRAIIRQTYAERGSYINDHVIFGGVVEALTFWADDFDDVSESDIVLDTAEIDFEVALNDWSYASLVFEYFDGNDFLFPTAEDDEVFVDRVNVRQAWITIGNTANYPLFATIGRDVVPFGISTGDPIADVLSIVDPLTVEVFETQEDFILIGFEGPTCCPPPVPTTQIPAPLPPRPLIFNPLTRRAATYLCSYHPCTPPVAPAPVYLPPPTYIPPFNGAVYFYNGDTLVAGDDQIDHMGGTLGYRTRGMLPRCIPWTIDVDVDVNSSVFDSNFLAFEYRTFLPQIGFQPGMASHVKSSVGPYAIIAEWNGAISEAEFIDDAGTPISIRPEAWQINVAYQFDWNPYVEVIGAQGTYVVVGYSESSDLAGVTKAFGDPLAPTLVRVGNVPERRLTAGVGEWVLDGLRVAFEYSHVIDYDADQGGTGNSADGVFMQVTYEW